MHQPHLYLFRFQTRSILLVLSSNLSCRSTSLLPYLKSTNVNTMTWQCFYHFTWSSTYTTVPTDQVQYQLWKFDVIAVYRFGNEHSHLTSPYHSTKEYPIPLLCWTALNDMKREADTGFYDSKPFLTKTCSGHQNCWVFSRDTISLPTDIQSNMHHKAPTHLGNAQDQCCEIYCLLTR